MVRARSNLAMARRPKPEETLWEDQCFQAHQAVEKALKAVYLRCGLLFKYVHDLEELAEGLERGGIRVPSEVRRSVILNPFAFEARYPGPLEPVTEREYREALALAAAVVVWAEKIVRSPDKPGGPLLKEKPAVFRVRRQRRKNTRRAVRRRKNAR